MFSSLSINNKCLLSVSSESAICTIRILPNGNFKLLQLIKKDYLSRNSLIRRPNDLKEQQLQRE